MIKLRAISMVIVAPCVAEGRMMENLAAIRQTRLIVLVVVFVREAPKMETFAPQTMRIYSRDVLIKNAGIRVEEWERASLMTMDLVLPCVKI